jgi:ribosome biogenesis GTPase
MRLEDIGWDQRLSRIWESDFAGPGVEPARIASSLRGAFILWTEHGDVEAPARPKLIRRAESKPCTGDWVALRTNPPVVEAVLPRSSRVARKASGAQTVEQVLGANVDVLFLVTGLDRDFNIRRLERYLAIARESGAQPVIVLNKADISQNLEENVGAVRAIAGDVAILPVSAKTGAGMDAMLALLKPGRTAALIGSSGVGKSALTNGLLGYELREVRALRESDQRGQHTTVGRELLRAPAGWLLMDLPGIREVQPFGDAGMEETFADIEELMTQCRFRDCGHTSEPGCAIRAAVDAGELDAARYANYQRIHKELAVIDRKQEMRRLQKQYRQSPKKRT